MTIPPSAFEQYTIAFYNLENLFDVHRDRNILDEDFTINGRYQWDEARYNTKLKNIADVISKIGYDKTGTAPAIIGVAEVENAKVLNDLIAQPKLAALNYNYVHYNSPDERGIDVAFLYRPAVFELQDSSPIHIHVETTPGVVDATRDILYVKGILKGMPIHVYVNHWPSRRDGSDSTNHKRVTVAKQLLQHINSIDPANKRIEHELPIPDSKNIVIIGDFNDDPENDSIQQGIVPYGFTNVTAPLKKYHRGSLNHDFKWNLFDQILISNSLNNDVPNALYLHEADIFDDIMLRQWKGKYRGQPARTFVGKRYHGGYSDHFPVFAVFRRN